MHAGWTALVQSVNAVGGVDVKIESTDRRGIYDSGTKLRFANGEIAHLDGEKALALARARNHNPGDYGLAGSNYDREKNQQKILAALQQKALAVGTILNPTSVNGLINSMGDNLISSFDTSHVQTLIGVASKLKLAEIKQLPFVGRQDGGEDLIQSYSSGGAYVGEVPVAGVFDYSVIQAYIAKNLSKNPVVREGAVIDVLNGSGQEGLAAGKAAGLKTDGYTVGVVSNAPTLATPAVTIYQLNSAMVKTAEALKHKYNVEPTPIQKGVAKYIVSDFNLTLTNQPTRYEHNTNYKNESELRDEFVEFINKHLKEQGILGDENSFKIKIQMDYERWFNWGGKALNKPHFRYSVKIYDNADRLLVSYTIPLSTTKYSYFKDIAVSAEIAAFRWDAEDEPTDIDLISKTLVDEIKDIGK